ncbi:hypothetical protein NL676_026857 [Syzygium grande]|nr:hypothetical protein NL676_026857 [Syzygium grande]
MIPFLPVQYGHSCMQSLRPLMTGSLVRLVTGLVAQPATTVTTLLYYSDLLPRHLRFDRLVSPELLHPHHFLFHFIINVLRCFC